MNNEEYLELVEHIEVLERTASNLRIEARRAKSEPKRAAPTSAAAAYEIEAVWLRGFIRRHSNAIN